MNKKLFLNKGRITELSREQSSSVKGGGTGDSTEHNFTCCWCTSNTNDETCSCGESVPFIDPHCPQVL